MTIDLKIGIFFTFVELNAYMNKFFLSIFIILTSNIAFSQSKFLKSGNIGTVAKTPPASKKLYGPVDFRELGEMIGEKFIVMPKSKSVQRYGYQDIYRENSKSLTDHLSYNDGVGLVLSLAQIKGRNGVFQDSLGNKYTSTVSNGQFNDLAPMRDLKEAEELFLHKSLWVKDHSLNTYDERSGETGQIHNVRLTRVTVEEIAVGTEEQAPVRFILKTASGKIGYRDVNMSGSNLSYNYRQFYSFHNTFWTYNPKAKYKFSPQIWKLIANQEAKIGMTTQQVKLSLGEPDEVNYSEYRSGTQEQWMYGSDSHRSYYYFRNGRLTGQN